MVESGLPIFTDPGVCAVVETTVQAAGFVGAGFLRGSGRNGRLCRGAALAAGGHLAVVRFGVWAGATLSDVYFSRKISEEALFNPCLGTS